MFGTSINQADISFFLKRLEIRVLRSCASTMGTMNQGGTSLNGQSEGAAKLTNGKSSSFLIENLLRPDHERKGEEFKEAPSKIKALTVAAHLAGSSSLCVCFVFSQQPVHNTLNFGANFGKSM